MSKDGIALFTLAGSNRLSEAVIATAIKLQRESGGARSGTLHLVAEEGEEIMEWLLRLPHDRLPVPVFDRIPRTGETKRHFRFICRGTDTSHRFPAWIPGDLQQAVKIYPDCHTESCAAQVLRNFLRWRPTTVTNRLRQTASPSLPTFERRRPYLA
ncbi:MAG: hypothetical protein AAB864_01465 [Patescibacteria group bacterium]